MNLRARCQQWRCGTNARAVVVALFVVVPVLLGQDRAGFDERVDVHLVMTRVHVSTPTGRLIAGLQRQDFIVSEDNQAVRVVAVQGPAGGDSDGVPQNTRAGISEPWGRETAAAPPDRVVLAFDTNDMEWPSLTRALERVRQFISSPRYAGTEWSVAMLGPGLVIVPPTPEVEEVQAGLTAIRRLKKGRQIGLWSDLSFRREERESLTEGYEARGDQSGDKPASALAEDAAAEDSAEQAALRLRARKRKTKAQTLTSLIRGLGAEPSNTAIWLFHGPGKRTTFTGPMSASLLLAVRGVTDAWREAADAAASLRMPVYSINVRGLSSPPTITTYARHVSSGGGGAYFISPIELGRTVSAQTGGRYLELNGVTASMESAFQEYGEAYEITYQVNRVPDGKEHKVEIRVSDYPLATLRYPRRYFDWNARERLVRALNTSAGIPKSGGSLPVELAVNRTKTVDERWKLTVGARTPSGALGLVEDPETGERSGSAEWFVALYGEDGLLDELDSQTLTVSANEADAIAGFELTVEPGDYTVAVAVLDRIDQKSGMAFVKVTDDDG